MSASEAIEHVTKRAQEISDPKTRQAYLDYFSKTFDHEIKVTEIHVKNQLMNNRIVALLGLLGLIAMVILVYFTPYVSKWQSGFMWVALCVFTAACCSVIPGFFEIEIKGWLRATGAIGIFVLMYLNPPAVTKDDYTNQTGKLKLFAAISDTSSISAIPVDFSPYSPEGICNFSRKAIASYYGASESSDTLTFYRKSDGKIYSTEKCNDIAEREIIVVSNKVLRLFHNTRDAYLYISKEIDRNQSQ